MEMEMEVGEEMSVASMMARLSAAAATLEDAAGRLAGREIALEASIGRTASREAELEQHLAEANATIASLKAGRKTLPAGVATLLAKDGATMEIGALDAALGSLSLEQRIAVKSQLMRSGLIG
jgi:hypothetical protein